MKRHLIWIIAGFAALTVAVPTIAAARDAGTPDDNGVPGEVRGNCDEAEHASDAACISIVVPTPAPAPSATTPSNSMPSNSVPVVTTPSSSTPSNSCLLYTSDAADELT